MPDPALIEAQRRRARDELGDDDAGERDDVRELEVACRVDTVEAGADAGDRRALALERALVRGGVGADRGPRDEREAGP